MTTKSKAAQTPERGVLERQKSENRIRILADIILRNSPIVAALEERKVSVELTGLRGGQFLVSVRTPVYYWNQEQFEQMVAGRNLFREIRQMRELGGDAIVIVESTPTNNSHPVSNGALRGAMVHVSAVNRIPIFHTHSTMETVDLLFAIANQLQFGQGLNPAEDTQDPAGVAAKKDSEVAMDPQTLQENVLQLLPGLTDKMARDLRRAYGSLRELFSAEVRDLMKIDGIGPKRAQKLVEFFNWHKTRR